MAWTLGELAEKFDGMAFGDPGLLVRPVQAGAVDPAGIAFCENRKGLSRTSGVGALLLPEDLTCTDKPYVQVPHPRAAFMGLLAELERPMPLQDGVHPTAVVDESCRIHPTASVGPYAVLEGGAVLGPGVRVHAFCYVGRDCTVGADSVLYPHAVLCQDVRLGDRCSVHPGAVVGAEGFGFSPGPNGWSRIPQVGGVRVGDDVEIRALASVERATCGATEIGDGVKIGNLVQVGHNVRIGAHALMVPMSGIGGSSVLGRRSVLGAQSGVSDHVNVADDVHLGAKGGAFRDIGDSGTYGGSPAKPLPEHLRVEALVRRLPDLMDRVRRLEAVVPAAPGKADG